MFVETIWNRLPLDDEGIADALEITGKSGKRTAISNCRMTAMKRKWPRWKSRLGWE